MSRSWAYPGNTSRNSVSTLKIVRLSATPDIAELANDWIGYLPNLEGHKLGGYQVWTGFHSYAEPGTGERVADEAVAMLKELAAK